MYKVIFLIIAIVLCIIIPVVIVIIKRNRLKETLSENFRNDISEDVFRNQYIVFVNNSVPKKLLNKKYIDTKTFKLHESTQPITLNIAHSNKLNVESVTVNNKTLILLGFILDYRNPQYKNKEILSNTLNGMSADATSQLSDLFKELQPLSGRFVLIYSSSSETIVIGDACGLRRIFYSDMFDKVVYGSSEKLILDVLDKKYKISTETRKYMNSDLFSKNEQMWVTSCGLDTRFSLLLPNHFIKFDKMHTKLSVNRIPFYIPDEHNVSNIVNNIKQILSGNILAISNRYRKLIQPITAGYDSRTLFDASISIPNVNYYVFDMSGNPGGDLDTYACKLLTSRFKKKSNVYKLSSLTDDFKKSFSEKTFMPRILKKTQMIQHHYHNNMLLDVININGNGAEICRMYKNIDNYNDFKKSAWFGWGASWCADFYKYNKQVYNNSIKKWYNQTNIFLQKYPHISIHELHFWEQFSGTWMTYFPFEQDIAIEEYSPWNCREIFLLAFNLPPEYRNHDNPKLMTSILDSSEYSSILSKIPINSDKIFEHKISI